MLHTDQLVPVSAVVPCYNCESSLERAISSIATQSRRPAEIILVNDASTDSTQRVIDEIQARYGPNWIRVITFERNSGPATARNAGWNAARYTYVAFLDADDAWQTEKLEAQTGYMQSHPGVALTAHGCKVLGVREPNDLNSPLRGVHTLTCKALLMSNRIATRTVMLKRELSYRFRDGKRYAEDYLLWLQMACDGNRMELLDADWAYVFKSAFGESGLSARMWKMEKGELAVFWQLAKEERISRTTVLACSAYSLLKYIRRLVIVAIRRFRVRFHFA